MDNSCESISRLEVKILALAEAHRKILAENQDLKQELASKERLLAELEEQRDQQSRVFADIDQRMVSLLSRIDDCLPVPEAEEAGVVEGTTEPSRAPKAVQVLPGMHDD